MLERIVYFSIRQRWPVLFAVLGLCALGVYNFQRLPIDAVPDITNVQVQINTEAPGFSPLESEQRVTFPIETAIAGLPRLEYTRSISRYGLSQVTVVFEDGTDIYFARQQVLEKLGNVALPAGVQPQLAPLSTAVGEVYRYVLNAPADMPIYEVRAIQDWTVKPALRIVSGLSVRQIARAFLVSEAAMEQRITRAKAKVGAAGIPFETPDAVARVERLGLVAAMLYLVFNEGYLASSGEESLRIPLSDEAIRLGRLLRLQRDHVLKAREECLTGDTGLDDAARLAGMAAIEGEGGDLGAVGGTVWESIRAWREMFGDTPLDETTQTLLRARFVTYLREHGE